MPDQTKTTDTAPTQAAPAFDNSAARFETVSLDWPLSINGVRYSEVVVTRMTVGQIADFLDHAKAAGNNRIRFPMVNVPDAVLDALDADDGDKIEEAMQRFLPRRYRVDPAPSPVPSDGGDSQPA